MSDGEKKKRKTVKEKPFVKLVKFDFLDRIVVFLSGKIDDSLETAYNIETSGKTASFDDVEKRIISEEDFVGLTFSEKGDGFIYLPEWSDSVLVHEAYHATKATLESVGITDEETGACFIEYLYQTVKTAHDAFLREAKKKKKKS